MPTPIFCCGAECGIVTAGATGGALHWNVVTGTVTADTTTFHAPGLRAYKFNPSASKTALTKNLSAPAVIVARMYFRFSVFPSLAGGMEILIATPASGVQRGIAVDSSGNLIPFGNSNGPTATTLSLNTWYRLDVSIDISTTTARIKFALNGSAFTDYTETGTISTWSNIAFGNTLSTATGTWWNDDICLSTTSGDYPLGAGGIIGLSPNADGTHNFNLAGDFKYTNTTNVAVGATDTWTHVDTVPLTQITDFLSVNGAANTEYLEWQFADTGTDVASINGLEVVSSHHSASTTANKETMRLNDGGTTADVFTDTDFSQTTICYNTHQFATAVAGGGAWTKAKVDALRVRWNSSFGTVDESPVPFIDGVMFEVDYVQSSNNPSQTDSATLSEAVAPVLALTPTETGTLTEAWASTLVATATDLLTVSESASASQGAGSQIATGADSSSLTEAPSLVAPVTAADSGALSESWAVGTPLVATDSAALSESARAVLTLTGADSAGLTETWSAGLAAAISDGPTIGESASASQGTGNQVATASDTLALTDTVVANLAAVGADSPTMTSETPSGTVGMLATDQAALSEAGQGFTGHQLQSQALIRSLTLSPRITGIDPLKATAVGTFKRRGERWITNPPNVNTPLFVADQATVSERAQVTLNLVAGDGAVASEIPATTLGASGTDSSAVSEVPTGETQSGGAKVASVADTVTVSETPLVTLRLTGADSGTLTESAAVGSSASPTFLEDFSEYASTANLRTNPAGKFTALLDGSSDLNETFNALEITLDQTQGLNVSGYQLSQCLLYSFPAANVSDYSIGCNLQLDQDYDEIWAELYAKFSTSFTTNGPASGNADYKFTHGRTRVTGRYMTFCGTFGDGWQFGYPGNDQGANSDVSGVYGNSDYPFVSSVSVWDGTWHRYRYHLKNSALGGAVFYIDNVKMPGFPIGTVNTSSGGSIWSWSLGRNNNKGQSVPMTVRWGRFAAYSADPGWGF